MTAMLLHPREPAYRVNWRVDWHEELALALYHEAVGKERSA